MKKARSFANLSMICEQISRNYDENTVKRNYSEVLDGFGFENMKKKQENIEFELFPRLRNIKDTEKFGLLSRSININFLKKLIGIRKESGVLDKISDF